MLEFLIKHQLDIMQALSGICAAIALLLFVTKALTKKRRRILILMQFTAMFLLIFDRMAYVYAGDLSRTGYIMVRLSNLIVFFLTSGVVFVFNLYIMDLLTDEGEMEVPPRRLAFVSILSCMGMFLSIINYYTGIYYIIDEQNTYHRTSGFLICYIIPVLGPLIQCSAVIKYRDRMSKTIRISLYLFLIVPIIMAVTQVFAYGLSITNMSIVLVSVFLYVFAYFDINDTIERAHRQETEHLKQERRSMKHLFEQTITAFASAVDSRDIYSKGRSKRVADYAKRLAEYEGLDKKECEDIYYAALVHDIGKIGIPEEVLMHADEPNEEEAKLLREKPNIACKILSSITEYPDLDVGAKYCNERYDGKGYPEGLKKDSIPRAARIITIANEYDLMTSRTSYREPLPQQIVREEFVVGSGTRFDPVFAQGMLRMIDADGGYTMREEGAAQKKELVRELHCKVYRDTVTEGFLIDTVKTRISFKCEDEKERESDFASPSLIIFDSYDAHVHNNEKTIGSYAYKEYAELWFDGHYISTLAKNMRVDYDETWNGKDKEKSYEIESVRFHDHIRIRLKSKYGKVEAIIALDNGVSWAYTGITGEHCHIYDISAMKTDETVEEDEIPRIADEVSYIDRLESDIPNLQINGTRSQSTKGIPVKDGLRIMFHTMSLPMATLVWHCPYIVLFYSENGETDGPGYVEYALIKLNGEDNGSKDYVTNNFSMKKTSEFDSWDTWKRLNKEGYECEVDFVRRGKKVTLNTHNLGIDIQNSSTILEGPDEIYVALTGDQIALTDIRVMQR